MKDIIESIREEKTVYQMAAFICFLAFIGFGYKYGKLKHEHQLMVKEKNMYCTEYYKLLNNKKQ